MMKSLLVLTLLVAAASSHLCLLGPIKQRGSMQNINTAGAKDCGLEDFPCGKRDPDTDPPMTTFIKGSNISIVFQKNLDHFNSAKPGAFFVNLWYGNPYFGHQVLSIPDSADAKSGYLYTPTITIGKDFIWERVTLQVNYMTNNPQAPPNFYQCTDFMVK